MKIFVGQIYVQPGVTFPFSHYFQKWLGQEMSKLVKPSDSFLKTYSDEYDLIIRLSAKSEIPRPEVVGPTVFKRDKDVEYTIFLPHSGKQFHLKADLGESLKLLMDSVATVLRVLRLDASQFEEKSPALIDQILSDPAMFELELK